MILTNFIQNGVVYSPLWENVTLRSISIGVILTAVLFIWGWHREVDVEANVVCSVLLGIFMSSSCFLFLTTPFLIALAGSVLILTVCGAIAGMG